MAISLDISDAFDIMEGILFGGLAGLGTYIIAGAVAVMPSSFLHPALVTPLTEIVGALVFLAYSFSKIRARKGI